MKILVVDDHALVREGLCQVLKGLDAHVDVLQASHCEQAFALARTHTDLDLVLLDYHLPDMNGLQALDVFGTQHPELPVVMLSGSANLRIVQEVVKSGAAGFVSKSGVSEELLSAIRHVLAGGVYMPSLPLAMPDAPEEADIYPLTRKQEQVLRELLNGRSNREISTNLHISEETVKTHITAILRHFQVSNRTQAVVAATRYGYRPSTR